MDRFTFSTGTMCLWGICSIVPAITYPARPLVESAQVHGTSVDLLLENLKLPEDRVRYRIRRELRGRSKSAVLAAVKDMGGKTEDEHHLLELLWVSWGLDAVDPKLLKRLLKADDFKVRAAAVHVLRYVGHQVPEQVELLKSAAEDSHGRVRLEAIAASSWLSSGDGLAVLEAAGEHRIDSWIKPVYETALAHLRGQSFDAVPEEKIDPPTKPLEKDAMKLYTKGAEVYRREGHCATCHQENGKGLPAAMFPPLAGTKWVVGSEERLIMLTLNGLMGPIEVKGTKYPGQVPMTQFKGLNDEEVAAVLTYVRNTFGNSASPISPEKVKSIRESTADKQGFYSPAELLEAFPHEG